MLAKIFVLFVIGINPQGQTLLSHQGQFPTQQSCELAQKDLRVRMQVAKMPAGTTVSICLQTPWNVPGQGGA